MPPKLQASTALSPPRAGEKRSADANLFADFPDDLNEVTVLRLRPVAKQLGLPSMGLKSELVTILTDARSNLKNLNPNTPRDPVTAMSILEADAAKAKQKEDAEAKAKKDARDKEDAEERAKEEARALSTGIVDPEATPWLKAASVLANRQYPKRLWLSWANAAVLLDPFCWLCLLIRDNQQLRTPAGTRSAFGREVRENLHEVCMCTPEEVEALFSSIEEVALIATSALASPCVDPFVVMSQHRARLDLAAARCVGVESRLAGLVDPQVAAILAKRSALSTLPMSETARAVVEKAKLSLCTDVVEVAGGGSGGGAAPGILKGEPAERLCNHCKQKVSGSIVRHLRSCAEAIKAYKERKGK